MTKWLIAALCMLALLVLASATWAAAREAVQAPNPNPHPTNTRTNTRTATPTSTGLTPSATPTTTPTYVRPTPPPTGTPGGIETQREIETVALINQKRVAEGLGMVTQINSLRSAARRHSYDIGPQFLCQHDGTDGSSPWSRIADAGFTDNIVGEVVGCSFSSSQGVVDAWWASPGHHDILTNPAANEIGCGWWVPPNGYGWVTCDVGWVANPTPTGTLTQTPGATTPTLTPTSPPTNTPTATFTRTPTRTLTPTLSPTGTPTNTPTNTLSATATGTHTPTVAPTVCQPVGWMNRVNVAVTANTIQKNAGAGSTWDAGAASTQAILSGDGYVQASVDVTNTYRMFGLSYADTNQAFGDIDYAAYLAGSSLMVYERGSSKGTYSTLQVGDVVKVAVQGGVVRYYLNGSLVYTSSATPTYPLLLDTAINSMSGEVYNAYICGANLGLNPTSTPTNTPTATATPTPIPPPTCLPVSWMNPTNVTVTANTIQKTGGAGSTWDAGAASIQAITSGDGSVQATVDVTGTYRMFGLSNGDTNQLFGDIDFAAYLAGSSFKVYESGFYKGTYGTLAPGDVVKVSIEAGIVRYYLNGALVYNSSNIPHYPLLLDTSINSTGGKVYNAYICATNLGVNPTSTPTVTPTATITPTATTTPTPAPLPTCLPVSWTNAVNVTVTANTIQKTGGAGSTWDAGAVSTQSIGPGDGYVQATVDVTSTYRMFGLSNGDTNQLFGDIDFAAYLAGSSLKVYEGGISKGTFGSLAVGDVVKVEVQGGTVRYYLNTAAIYTSTLAPTYPLLLDTAINSLGGKVYNAYICAATTAKR